MTDIDIQNMRPLPSGFTTIDDNQRESFTPIMGVEPKEPVETPQQEFGIVEQANPLNVDILPQFYNFATETPEDLKPNFSAVYNAMMRQHNWIAALQDTPFGLNSLPRDSMNYDPLEDPDIDSYYWSDVMYARSPYEAQILIEHRQRRDRDRQIISESDIFSNIAAGAVAGLADPFTLLFAFPKVFKTGSIIGNTLKTSGSYGLANMKAIGSGELILHALQPERTIDETLQYLTVGGALGGVVGAFAGRTKFNASVQKDLEDAIQAGQMDNAKQFNTGPTGNIYSMPDSMPGSKRFMRDPRQQQPGIFSPGQKRIYDPSRPGPTRKSNRKEPKTGNEKTWGPLDSAQAFMSPGYRVLASPFSTASRIVEDLVELAGKRHDGRSSRIAVETLQKQHMYQLVSARQEINKLYHNYRIRSATVNKPKGNKKPMSDWVEPLALSEVRQRFSRLTGIAENAYMTPGEFRIAVTNFVRNKQKNDVKLNPIEPEVQEAGKIAQKIFDYYKDEAIAAKLLNADDVVDGYVTRIYNQYELKYKRDSFIKTVMDWQRQNPTNPITGKETRVLTKLELNKAVDKIIESGRNLDGADGAGPKGVFKERSIDIPDEVIGKFLVNDIDDILTQYTRIVSTDVEIAKKFGSIDMKKQIDEITKEANDMIAKAGSQKKKNDLARRLKADLEAIEALRDIQRGVYGLSEDPYAITSRAARLAMDFNNFISLNAATFASLADTGRVIMTQGLTDTFKVLRLQIKDYKTWKGTVKDTQLSGTALDLHLHSTVLQLTGMQNLPPRFSKAERTTGWLTNAYFMFNLLSPWNHFMKSTTGTIVQHKMVGDALSIVKGTATKNISQRFKKAGLNSADAKYIVDQWSKHGDTVQGVRILNTQLWDNPSRLRNIRAAVAKDVDTTIVTPSAADMPLWTHNQWGRLVAQYKSFSIAAANKVLIPGVQFKDAHQLMGLLTMVYLGGTISNLRADMNKAPGSQNIAEFVVDGIDQSGVLGWFFQANNMLEAISDNEIGFRPMTGQAPPYGTSTSWKLGQIAPVLGTGTKAAQILEDVVLGDMDYHTYRKIKSFSPIHKHFLVRLGELGRQKENLKKVNEQTDTAPVDAIKIPNFTKNRQRKVKSIKILPNTNKIQINLDNGKKGIFTMDNVKSLKKIQGNNMYQMIKNDGTTSPVNLSKASFSQKFLEREIANFK